MTQDTDNDNDPATSANPADEAETLKLNIQGEQDADGRDTAAAGAQAPETQRSGTQRPGTQGTGTQGPGKPGAQAPAGGAETASAARAANLAADGVVPRPRIRSGAIVWGVIVSAFAVLLLVVVTSPQNTAAFGAWAGSLGWGGAILTAVIALGAFILIMALLSAIRGAQRRRAAS